MKSRLPVSCLLLAASGFAGNATAQVLEEILVTAQKREQNLQDVGISVSAFTGQQMAELGMLNVSDIAAQAPNVTFVSPFGEGNNIAFTLRGVGLNDFSEHNEAPGAVYVDGVYQGTLAGANFQLFDLDRVEVLRGPQGTLFGRNTSAGLVQYITRKPSDEPEARAELTVGEFSQTRFEGAVGGPLGDIVSGRLAALYHKHDGYRPSRTPGVEDGSATDASAVRGQLEVSPSEDLDLLFSAHYSKADQVANTYEHTSTTFLEDGYTEVFLPADEVNPICEGVGGLTGPGQDCFGYRDTDGDVYATDNDREPFLDLEVAGGSLTLDWTVSAIDVTSITAYESVEKSFGEDTDMGPVPAIAVSNPVDSEQWSQELRAASAAGPNRWTIGLYYFDRDIDTGSRTDVSGIGLVDDDTVTRYQTESWAVFGQYEWGFTEDWTLTLGGRYFSEDQEFEMVARDLLGNTPFFLGISPEPIPGFPVFVFTPETAGDLTKHDVDGFDYRLALEWRASDSTLLYASTARGTKAPGFNFAIDGTGILGNSTIEQIPFDEETLTAYEIGLKTELFNGSTRVNSALFYYDYDDFQAFSFEGITNVVSNKQAEITGLEVEITTRPTENLDLTLTGAWLDTEVDDIVSSSFFTGETVSRTREMVAAPSYEFSGIARYTWPTGVGDIFVQGDFNVVGDQFFDIANNPITDEDSYAVYNASLGWASDDGQFELVGWVRNLSDEEYRTYAIPVTSLGFTQNMYGKPRWYGVTFTLKLNGK
jgi:iron complex outermembrane receptor protein